jgi:signal transduction histidine kinase
MGLMLAKEFLDKNNAVVTVESDIGKGTKFSITI